MYIYIWCYMNIYMSIPRSVELRRNTSGSYKVRLTVSRGSRFCGARKSLGLGTRDEACALRRACLMQGVLFHLGWIPCGRAVVKHYSGNVKKVQLWSIAERPLGPESLQVGGDDLEAEGRVIVWYQMMGEELIRCRRLRVAGWDAADYLEDLRVLTQGLQNCAVERRQQPCRILKVEMDDFSPRDDGE